MLDRMVQANPGEAEAFLVRARFLKQENRPDECMRDLDRVFVLDPENGEALVLSAEVLQTRGDIRAAKDALREAIALYPRYAEGYRSLSWLELLSGNQTDAIATLERGVAAIPEAPDLLTPLADLWVEQGDLDRVEGIMQKLEARKDSTARVSYLRGRLQMKRGRWNEALTVLEGLRTDATALPGLAAQLNLLIASCHERRGDRDAQVEALKRALSADPNHLGARVALASAYLNAGRIEDALKECQAASRSPFAGLGVQVTYGQLRLSWARVTDAPPEEWTAIGILRACRNTSRRLSLWSIRGIVGRSRRRRPRRAPPHEAAARPGPGLWTALAAASTASEERWPGRKRPAKASSPRRVGRASAGPREADDPSPVGNGGWPGSKLSPPSDAEHIRLLRGLLRCTPIFATTRGRCAC